MTIGIYAILHVPSGQSYIGASTDIEARWGEHQSTLNRHAHPCLPLQALWDHDGAQHFAWDVLETCSGADLGEREFWHIEMTSDVFNSGASRLPGRGGSRAGSGRPSLNGVRMRHTAVRLTLEQREKARQLGSGDIGAGIRLALDQHEPA